MIGNLKSEIEAQWGFTRALCGMVARMSKRNAALFTRGRAQRRR